MKRAALAASLLVAALAVAALAVAALAVAEAPFRYRFDEVKSKVMRAPGGDAKLENRVQAGETAEAGDVVWTGWLGRAVVVVPERASRFEIEASTRVRLASGEPGVLLVLEKGRLRAFFDALAGGGDVERRIATPGALLAVRGTRYGVEVRGDGEALLAVFEGTVEVIPTAGDFPKVRVGPGQACLFGPRRAPRSAPMREMGMDEHSWGMRSGMGPQGSGMDGRRDDSNGRTPGQQGGSGSSMGPKGH
jgi:ferric-dicitrate binding protein FerR (iron transport regulator)